MNGILKRNTPIRCMQIEYSDVISFKGAQRGLKVLPELLRSMVSLRLRRHLRIDRSIPQVQFRKELRAERSSSTRTIRQADQISFLIRFDSVSQKETHQLCGPLAILSGSVKFRVSGVEESIQNSLSLLQGRSSSHVFAYDQGPTSSIRSIALLGSWYLEHQEKMAYHWHLTFLAYSHRAEY